jgi:hypothetical protein
VTPPVEPSSENMKLNRIQEVHEDIDELLKDELNELNDEY